MRVNAKVLVYRFHVRMHRMRTQLEVLGDFFLGEPLEQQVEDAGLGCLRVRFRR